MLLSNHQGIHTFLLISHISLSFRTTVPYFTQIVKQELEDDIDWNSLSAIEQQNYKRKRREVNIHKEEFNRMCSLRLGTM